MIFVMYDIACLSQYPDFFLLQLVFMLFLTFWSMVYAVV